MADVTGGKPPTGLSPFRPPEDFQAVYEHFGSPDMFSVASASALPTTGNWPGRTLVARDKGVLYVNPAGDATWRVAAVRPWGTTPSTLIYSGRTQIGTDPNGLFDLVFPTAFPTACDRVVANVGEIGSGAYAGPIQWSGLIASKASGRLAVASTYVWLDWIAVGR